MAIRPFIALSLFAAALPAQGPTTQPAASNQKGTKTELSVTILDRRDSETNYSYVVPGHFRSNANTDVNCFGTGNTASCSGFTTTTGTSTPAQAVSYQVRGATFSLKLPDGRIAVVNCESKFAEHFAGPQGNRRSCRIPLVDDLRAEFDGDKAKLKWSVSLNGSKMESETYKILAVLDKP